MPINFFQQSCKESSNESAFGLCDDTPPPNIPAYIDENDTSKWIATVENLNNKNVDFYAIDNCLTILKPNATNDKESTSEGFLHHTNDLVFVELKDRVSSGWLKKGREQLTNTIRLFSANHDITAFSNIEAYVANKQRPLANAGFSNQIEQFKDDTKLILNDNMGLILKVQATISI